MTDDRRSSDETRLSVVVVVLGGPAYVPRCLDALLEQELAPAFEIIVPHDDRLPQAGALSRRYPAVRFLRRAGRRSFAELRAFGVGAARGAIVAVTEDHCIPRPDWCRRILTEHGEAHAAVGGAVDKQRPDRILNWAVYLSDFSRYANPVREGPSEYLTDCNVSYRRTALDAIADVWSSEFHETTVNWTLRDRGESLWLSPHVVVRQQRSMRWGTALRERFSFGRLFASTRVEAVGSVRRLAYAGASVLLPALLLGRVVKNVFRKGRYRAPFIAALPAIVLLATVWTAGELTGYVTGRAGRPTLAWAEAPDSDADEGRAT